MPRWRVVIEKFGALVVVIAVLLVATFLGFAVGGPIAGPEHVRDGRVLLGVLNMGPLTLFFAALTMAVNGVQRSRGAALGVPVALAAGTWIVHAMAAVADMPEALQKLSPWTCYDDQRALVQGVRGGHMALLLALAIVLLGVAAWGFERRDVGL